jgi:hypothetical protein
VRSTIVALGDERAAATDAIASAHVAVVGGARVVWIGQWATDPNGESEVGPFAPPFPDPGCRQHT